MRFLELKIPPVALALLCAGAMWLSSKQFPSLTFVLPGRIPLTIALSSAGMGLAAAALLAFRRARTTVDPTHPGTASTLVASGVYRWSRNPMYAGLLFGLAGWAVFLAHPLAALIPPAFLAYMNRFQILPEERALTSTFGEPYTTYCQSVRRWL